MALAITALALMSTLGSTLASNISINLGESVEFGQGIATTSVCDDQITITPIASFINAPGAGAHYLTSLRLSGIDSSEGKCSGKTFVIKAFGENGLLDLFNYTEFNGESVQDQDYNSIEIFNNAGNFLWTSGGTDGDDVIDVVNDNITETAFTVNLVSAAPTITRTPLALAANVKKFTIETYSKEELTDRVFSSAHVGIIFLPESEEVPGYQEIFAPFQRAEFNLLSCDENCWPYMLLRDWIEVLYDLEDSPFAESNLSRTQFADATTIRLESTQSEDSVWNWTLYLSLPSQGEFVFQPISGAVIGFTGQTAVFVPAELGVGAVPLLLSIDRPLTDQPVVGDVGFFLDSGAPEEIPVILQIRNLLSIWDFPQTLG